MNDMNDNMKDLSCHQKENQMRLNVYDVYDFIFGRDSYSLAFDNEMAFLLLLCLLRICLPSLTG